MSVINLSNVKDKPMVDVVLLLPKNLKNALKNILVQKCTNLFSTEAVELGLVYSSKISQNQLITNLFLTEAVEKGWF